MRPIAIVLFILTIEVVIPSTNAATILVPSQQPTIQEGINAAANGDTVLVAPGLYLENLSVVSKAVHIVSSNGSGGTAFKWNHNGTSPFLIRSNAMVEFSGFDWSSDLIVGNAFDVQSSSLVLTNNVFDRLSTSALVFAESTGTVVLSRNLFSRIGTSNAMIIAWRGAVATITNNTIDSVEKAIAVYSDGSLVENNIFSRCTQYAYYDGGFSVVERYNCFWANTDDTYDSSPVDLTDISADPAFTNAATGDYQLHPTSPCINAGNFAPQYLDSDGTRNDIGAFPHTNLAPSTPVLSWPVQHTIVASMPVLWIQNSVDPEDDSLTYEFSGFHDTDCVSGPAIGLIGVAETPDSTGGQITEPLAENCRYFWRVRAYDGFEYSSWSDLQTFLVDGSPETPSAPQLVSPPFSDGKPIFTMLPTLAWIASFDPDPGDTVRYKLELSLTANFGFVNPVDSLLGTSWSVADSLYFGTHYWWRIIAKDKSGLTAMSVVNDFWTWKLGDMNHSNSVDLSDLSLLITYLTQTPRPAIDPKKAADLSGDCKIDLSDLSLMVAYMTTGGVQFRVGCE